MAKVENSAYNYYQHELDRIDIPDSATYSPRFQFVDCFENKTKWLDLNKESAKVLIKWLNENLENLSY